MKREAVLWDSGDRQASAQLAVDPGSGAVARRRVDVRSTVRSAETMSARRRRFALSQWRADRSGKRGGTAHRELIARWRLKHRLPRSTSIASSSLAAA